MTTDTISQEQLDALIGCAKRVEGPTGRERQEAQHRSRDYALRSEDGEYSFVAFTRQNVRVADDFSAGLRWIRPSGADVILVRCNGSSHAHRNALEDGGFADRCHVHLATERYVAADRRIETYAEPDDTYRTLAGALHRLTNIANIAGIETVPDHPDLFES